MRLTGEKAARSRLPDPRTFAFEAGDDSERSGDGRTVAQIHVADSVGGEAGRGGHEDDRGRADQHDGHGGRAGLRQLGDVVDVLHHGGRGGGLAVRVGDRAGQSRLVLAGDGHVAVIGDVDAETRLDEAEVAGRHLGFLHGVRAGAQTGEVDHAGRVRGEFGGFGLIRGERPLVRARVPHVPLVQAVVVELELGSLDDLVAVGRADLLQIHVVGRDRGLIGARPRGRHVRRDHVGQPVRGDQDLVEALVGLGRVDDPALVGHGHLLALVGVHEALQAGDLEAGAVGIADLVLADGAELVGHVRAGRRGRVEGAVHVDDAGHVVLEGDGVHGQLVRHGERGLEVAGLAVGRGRGILPRAVHALDLLVDLGDVGLDLGGAEGLAVAHPDAAADRGGHEDRDSLGVDDEIIALRQGQVQTARGGGLVGLHGRHLAGRGGGLQGAGDLAQRVRIGLQPQELFGGVTAFGRVVGHAVLVQRGLDPRVGRGVRG